MCSPLTWAVGGLAVWSTLQSVAVMRLRRMVAAMPGRRKAEPCEMVEYMVEYTAEYDGPVSACDVQGAYEAARDAATMRICITKNEGQED